MVSGQGQGQVQGPGQGQPGLGGPRSWTPGVYFCIDAFFIIVLLGGAILFATGILPAVHAAGRPGAAFLLVIPYWVPWAGALGGVSISLVGVARYAGAHWDANQWGYWHLARPFLGSVFGTIAVLIIVLVLKTVTSVNTREPYTPQGVAVLCVFSYVVGFREESFRELVLKVVDVILGPGSSSAPGTTVSIVFVPDVLDLQLGPASPSASAPTSASGTVHLFNGSADNVHVAQAGVQSGDPSLSVVPPVADTILAPAQSLEMTIVWKPQDGARSLDSYLSVTTGGRAARLTVHGAGS